MTGFMFLGTLGVLLLRKGIILIHCVSLIHFRVDHLIFLALV